MVTIPSPPVFPAPEDASSLLQTKTHLHAMKADDKKEPKKEKEKDENDDQ